MKQVSRWNLANSGGWKAYETITNDYAGNINEIIDNEDLSVDEVVKKIDGIQDKIKYTAFGKTKVKKWSKIEARNSGKNEHEKAVELLQRQSTQVEEAIEKIKDCKGGKCGQIFKMKDLINGPRKGQEEGHAIQDPESKELVVGTEEIKKVSLKHCLTVLKKNAPDGEWK